MLESGRNFYLIIITLVSGKETGNDKLHFADFIYSFGIILPRVIRVPSSPLSSAHTDSHVS